MSYQNTKEPLKAERLTITLGDDQRRKIASIAREDRTSIATIIRQAVDCYIARRSLKGPRAKAKPR